MVARPLIPICLVGLGGCSNYHTVGPEAWWHDAIGGKIAEQRPAPPGDKDPYPNLATVPPRPPRADTTRWNEMTAGLITDRIKAEQAAALAPIPDASSGPAASSGPVQPPPQVQEQGASATMVAASPPPAASANEWKPPNASAAGTAMGPTATLAPGPAAARASGPTAAAAPAPAAARAPTFDRASQTTSTAGGVAVAPASSGAAPTLAPMRSGAPTAERNAAERVANGQLPALPTQEPPRPGIAPPAPPPLVPLTATPPTGAPNAGGTGIDFDRGSAALNDAALADVRALAAVRGDRGIAITGYGDATSSDPLAQSDAIGLGLSRAQALATALVARGVPYSMLRLNAESAGRGASLRLLQ